MAPSPSSSAATGGVKSSATSESIYSIASINSFVSVMLPPGFVCERVLDARLATYLLTNSLRVELLALANASPAL